MPRLSVIIPFYDETAFLGAAVQSVLAQGIADTEIVVVNDNPERFTAGAVAALCPARSVTVVQHDRNAGLSAARNSGMAATSGARIAFLDADDYYVPGGLAAQLELAEAGGADIVQAQTYFTAAGSVVPRLLQRDAALFWQARRGAGLRGIEEAQFITSSWSSLYTRAFLTRAGLHFDPAQTRFEDRLFVLQAVTAARSIAVLGAPVRVWRRRAGSISVTPPDAATHRLQVQLLEKCMRHMRRWVAETGAPPRFLRRELFNTVSRLIWDMEVIGALAAATDDAIADLGPRIVALLGDDRFGPAIFDDPVLARIGRVGRPSRHGVIRQVDFFALHAALRGGDFAAAAAILAMRRAAAAPALRRAGGRVPARLVLHLGMHKTGTTAIQAALAAGAPALARRGVLFPVAGRAAGHAPVRPGGNPGHQALVAALHRDDPAPWDAIAAEARRAGAATVVVSAENLLLPRAEDRAMLVSRLVAQAARFDAVAVVAMVRRPDSLVEAFLREAACNGERGAGRGAAAMAVDLAPVLTDLPALFAPFEAAGAALRLGDFDAARAAGALWPAFLGLAGIEAAGLDPPPRVYPTPHRAEVLAAQTACAMIASEDLRLRTLRAFFAVQAAAPLDLGPDAPLLSPADRLATLDRFAAVSAAWAAARGYAPDLDAARAAVAAEAWEPPAGLPAALVERLAVARIMAERPADDAGPAVAGPPPAAQDDRAVTIRIRPRPWLAALIDRARRARRV